MPVGAPPVNSMPLVDVCRRAIAPIAMHWQVTAEPRLKARLHHIHRPSDASECAGRLTSLDACCFA